MAVQRFSFLRKNLLSDDTTWTFSSNSITSSNLYDKKLHTKWQSFGENTDGVTSTIAFIIQSLTNLSRIALINHNFANFNINYVSHTAWISLTTFQFNPGLSMTSNTNSNTFYSFATIGARIVYINIWNTFPPNTEKSCGEIIISNHKFSLNHNPEYTEYQPTFYKKGFEFEKYDGGIESVFFGTKFRANINLNYINTATYNSMKDLYNDHDDFIFVPYGQDTTTSNWNGEIYPVNWVGDLQIDNLINNNLSNGFTGNINLMQI